MELKAWTIFTGIFFLAFCACSSKATEPKTEVTDGLRVMDTTELEKYNAYLSYYFDTLLNYRDFSGGILVAKNGTIIYEHYQGDVYGGGEERISDRTPFHVASTSKTFTSTAILQLEAQGRLNIEDSVTTYFPDFPYKNITIRNLLTHSSGIPNYANFLPQYKWDRKIDVSNRDVLDVIIQYKPKLEFTTGARFKYCNTNYVILALIVENASGLSFPAYVKEYIFDVAGMQDSYVLSTENVGNYMPSWNQSGRIYNFDYLDGLYGDKNVFTTCRDLMKYDDAIRKNLLLDPLFYQKAWEPNYRDGGNESWEYYGLGWRLKMFNNNLKIPYHNGWWHGNNSVFQRLILDTAVIIVTGNRYNSRIYSAARVANLFRPYYPASAYMQEDHDAFLKRTSSEKTEESGDLIEPILLPPASVPAGSGKKVPLPK